MLLLLLALQGLLLLISPAWRLQRAVLHGRQQGCCQRGCCEPGCCQCAWPRCLGAPSAEALLGAATAALELLSALLHPGLLPWTAVPAHCDMPNSAEGAWHLCLCVSAVALLLRLLLLLALASASFGSIAIRLGSAASLKLVLPFAALALALGAGVSLPLWSAAHDPSGEQAAEAVAKAGGAEGAVSDLFSSFPGAALQLLLLASGGGLGSGDTWLAMQRGTQPVGAALLVASYLLLLCGGAAALLLGLVGGAARNAAAHDEAYALYRARWVLRAEGSLLGRLLRTRQLRCGGHDHAYTPMERRPDGGDGGDGAARHGSSARHRGSESWGLEVEEEQVAAGVEAGSDRPDGWRLSAGAAARAAWVGEEAAADAGRGAARDDAAHWHGAARRRGAADDVWPRREGRSGGGGGGALEAAWAGQEERLSDRDDPRPAFGAGGAGGAGGAFRADDAAVEDAVARLEARLAPLVSQLQRAARDAAPQTAARGDYGAPHEGRAGYGVEAAWQAEAGGAAESRLLNAQGVLVVTLQHASGLKPMDRNGSSDPYAKLSLAGGTRTSKVVVSKRPDPPATPV